MTLLVQDPYPPITDPGRLSLMLIVNSPNEQGHHSPGHDPDCEHPLCLAEQDRGDDE